MPYGKDLAGSARRHIAAATVLHDRNRPGHNAGDRAVAGYLFGLAGELALKKMMIDSGMRELKNSQRVDDPFYAHFPNLRTLLRDSAKGRRQGELLRHATDDTLFQFWDTSMRYAPTKDIDSRWTARWKLQAEKLVGDMEL
jgi:hypothetical protein